MINVTLGEAKPQEKPFPKLMIITSNEGGDEGSVILFQSPGVGTTVFTNNKRYPIGYHCCTWFMERFTDYNEPITLQNA